MGVICSAHSCASACTFLANAAAGVAQDLSALAADQNAEFLNFVGQPDLTVTYRYVNAPGPPRITALQDGTYLVLMMRPYILDVLVWSDHIAACDLDRSVCARTNSYLDHFEANFAGMTAAFEPLVRNGPDRTCPTRGTEPFAAAFTSTYLTAMLFMQVHEIAHVMLGHFDQTDAPDALDEAAADGFAFAILQNMDGMDGIYPRLGAAALLPLVRPDYRSAFYPDPRCRVTSLGYTLQDSASEGLDCAEYQQSFAAGVVAGRAAIGPDTTINSDP
ncbi:MAG: hypothetical protein AAGF88_09695 [Pseudomonadota bacterium]